jgi:hypothetical protein
VEVLDDVLLSIVNGAKVGDYSRDSARQVAITFQTREECTDVKIRKTKDYIERYLNRALSILLGRNDYLRNNNDTLSVKVSPNTAADTAMQMASILLPLKAPSGQWQLLQIQTIRDKFQLELIEDESMILFLIKWKWWTI